jgi:aspartate carbamoyltransferase catalytic subunit
MRTLTEANAKENSSLRKGESLKDTFRTLSQYGDIIVCRHPDPCWIEDAEKWSRIPVINAGSGDGEHPTQALIDLYTIKKELGRLEGLNVLLCGDLTHSRTVHSLIELLKLYQANVCLVPANSPGTFGGEIIYDLPQKYHDKKYRLHPWLDTVDIFLGEMDIVYMTRIQKERHWQQALYRYFKLTPENVKLMRQESAILHPLPRGSEIDEGVDEDPRAAYHERQVKNGLYLRVALLKILLDGRR